MNTLYTLHFAGPAKTTDDCKLVGKRIHGDGGSPLSEKFYDGLGDLEGCYERCKTLAGCRAVVWVNNSRCFVKVAGYPEPTEETTENRTATALEMCCMEDSCPEDTGPA